MSNKDFDTYNLDIHPLVERIFLVCNQTNMPAFMVFQDKENEFRTSRANCGDSSSNKMLISYLMATIDDSEKPQGNEVDDLISAMIRNGQKNGHDSVFLSALGVPKTPEN